MLASWSAEEVRGFEEGIRAYRKTFDRISRECVPSKSVKDVVAYYYRFWKRCPAYGEWKRDSLVGRRVRRPLADGSHFDGTIVASSEWDGEKTVRVLFDDTDIPSEMLFRYEVQSMLVHPRDAPARDVAEAPCIEEEGQQPHDGGGTRG
jgi:hypothetical protein